MKEVEDECAESGNGRVSGGRRPSASTKRMSNGVDDGRRETTVSLDEEDVEWRRRQTAVGIRARAHVLAHIGHVAKQRGVERRVDHQKDDSQRRCSNPRRPPIFYFRGGRPACPERPVGPVRPDDPTILSPSEIVATESACVPSLY